MAKRELEEINAGSVADIAFLLLIFFLITTTMNFPKALEERLPQKVDTKDAPLVRPENVFEILANANDDILLEGKRGSIEEIKDQIIEFYNHPIGTPGMPKIEQITNAKAQSKVKEYQMKAAQYPDDYRYGDTLRKWEKKLMVTEAIGTYNQITDKAMVTIQLDNATKFKTYLSVLNEIMVGLNELRGDLCLEKFGRPMNKLNKKVEADQEVIKVLRQVYPKTIMKAKARNVGA